jgi:hypothetical protein
MGSLNFTQKNGQKYHIFRLRGGFFGRVVARLTSADFQLSELTDLGNFFSKEIL